MLDLLYSPNKLKYNSEQSQSHSELALDEAHKTFLNRMKLSRHGSVGKHTSFFTEKEKLKPNER